MGVESARLQPTYLKVAAILYVFSAPLDTVPLPFGSPALVAGAILLLCWCIALARGSANLPKSPIFLTVLALLPMWSYATVAWSYAPVVSLVSSTSTLFLALSAVAVASVFRGEVLGAAIALAAGSTLAGVLTLIGGREAIESDAGILTETQQWSFLGIDQNALAFSLCVGLAAALFASMRCEGVGRRFIHVAMALVLVWSLILVGSRTGVGSMIATGVVFLMVSAAKKRTAVAAIAAVLAALAIGKLLAEAGLIPQRLVEWLQQPVATDSRVEIIEVYRVYISEWLVKGVGAGADADYLFAKVSWFKNAHSAFWKIWIETGLVGLVLWSALLLGVAFWSWRSLDRVFFLLLVPPIALFFYSLGGMQNNALWVVFGLALGAAFSSPSTSPESTAPAVAPVRSARPV